MCRYSRVSGRRNHTAIDGGHHPDAVPFSDKPPTFGAVALDAGNALDHA